MPSHLSSSLLPPSSPRPRSAFTLIDPRLREGDKAVEGFTLIELLVVIAILAILAVVVVLTLNPAGLLQEARDSNRLSDMGTLNNAIGLYEADAPTASLGTSSILYVSIPDTTATSTQGDQCQGLGLPALPVGWSYQCPASGTAKKSDGTGWIPVNLAASTFGTPLPNLPIDPVNTSSSGLYYTYATNGTQFEIASLLESAKYKLQFANIPVITGYPEVNAKGTNLTLNPLWNASSLVGYWPMDEGTGSSTLDQSGSGNNGIWGGASLGTNTTHYVGGKVGTYAGAFDGSTNYVSSAWPSNLESSTTWSVSLWSNGSSQISNPGIFGVGSSSNYTFFYHTSGQVAVWWGAIVGSSSIPVDLGQWDMWTIVRNGTNFSAFKNGSLISQGTTNASTSASTFYVGIQGAMAGGQWFNGSIDDVRVYSRALSNSEIQALYNAEK